MPRPKTTATPQHIRPYTFHGFRMEGEDGSGNVTGTCPFCSREGKFSIKKDTGQWRCFVCQSGSDKGGGNIYTFLRSLWKASDEATTEYLSLVKNRKLLFQETLMFWGVCQSVTTGDWLVPGHSHDNKLNQLYRYIKDIPTGKMLLLPTPELGHHIHGVTLYDPAKPLVYVCEGPWDAMALHEVLRRTKVNEDGTFAATANEQASLMATANVLAIPGCGSVGSPFERWLPLFAGKKLVLMFDSDHPKTNNGKPVEPAGYAALRRAVDILGKSSEPPASVHYLNWGDKGYDARLPSGYDVRDHLTQSADDISSRVARLKTLLEKVIPIPSSWVPGRNKKAAPGGLEIDCITCLEWGSVVNAARKALKWTEGLDRGMSVAFAVVISTKAVGDQLWVKMIGPAGCGKSTLCEALSVNKKYTIAKSTIRGFHSGYQVDRSGEEDSSLLAQVQDKTLITKDGDTLLQSPNLTQILAEARDVYDRTSRTHYRNQMSRDYEGINMTWLLCGTSSLRRIDSSELGERFLDCVIVEDMDEDLEDEIAMRVAYRAEREMAFEADGKMETRDGPDMVKFKQLTGGYIRYLRENARELLSAVTMTDRTLIQCHRLAKFVACMRARPSAKQEEKSEREMCFRLTSQLVRLAKCLTAVLNKEEADTEVMRRVTRVAIDTARGRTMEIVKCLYREGELGLYMDKLALYTNQPEEKEKLMVRFMGQIRIVELYRPKSMPGVSSRARWRLTTSMRQLYGEVLTYAK